ncbi:MAG: UbiD family decarboxylase, partial [Acidobacteriota bacterium]|nr:UbiD family decarboxylase [Acidobacteriota bacterium]
MSRNHSLLRSAARDINDLRSAIDFLAGIPGQLAVIKKPVDAYCELAGVYKKLGAGTPVIPPTQPGPAALFENVKGYDIPVVTGMLATRERTALLMGSTKERLPRDLLDAVGRPIPPVMVSQSQAPSQEVVHGAPLDIMKILPVPTVTPLDAGPTFCIAMLYAADPETGEEDVTIHRMCVQGPDEISVYFITGRHIDYFRQKAEKLGKPLPVSINIGLDPAIHLTSCFEEPTTPLGFNELGIAGAVRGRAVEMVNCVSVKAKALARAEIVIEGEILPGRRIAEDCNTGKGWMMPEFPGYMGKSQPSLPVMKVTAITHRKKAIFQTLVGPGLEHVNLLGIPTEASIMRLLDASLPGRLVNVYEHPSGGGKYLAILQIRKDKPTDEGRQRQAALAAFAAFPELKHIVLVDEDVNIYDTDDVLWAMTTRYQGDRSTVFLPGVFCHVLDPSSSPAFNPSSLGPGIACKVIYDCTVPYTLKQDFKR